MSTPTNISQTVHNYNYAPGIATYGQTGETGQAGQDGNNIYYTNINFEDPVNIKDIAAQIKQNYLPITNSTEKLSRQYKNGDYFFNLYGVIYVLHNIDELLQQDGEIAVSYKKFFNKVGSITVETLPYMQMTNSGRLQLNTSTYKGFDIIDADIQGITPNKNSALNIISDKTDSDNNINFLHITSVNNQSIDTGNLKIYFDTNDNAYHISSNYPIVLQGDVKVNSVNVKNSYDEFSSILTSNDTVTYFKSICDQTSYYISYEEDPYVYLILFNDYALNFYNEYKDTMYIKLYGDTNEQYLLPMTNLIASNDVNKGLSLHLPLQTASKISLIDSPSSSGKDKRNGRYVIPNTDFSNSATVTDGIGNITTTITTPNSDINNAGVLYAEAALLSDRQVAYFNDGVFTPASKDKHKLRYSMINTYMHAGKYSFNFKYIDPLKDNLANTTYLQFRIRANIEPYQYSDNNEIFWVNFNLNDTLKHNVEYTVSFDIVKDTPDTISITDITLRLANPKYKSIAKDAPYHLLKVRLNHNISNISKVSLLHNTEIFLKHI